MKRKWLFLMAVSMFLLGGCGATSSVQANSALESTGAAPVALPGHQAPDFTLKTIDGQKTVSLHELLGKEPILLNAWASWCGPCREETPELVQLSKQYAGKIEFIGINMTQQEQSLSDAKSFVKQYKIPYLTLQDTDGSFMNSYNINGFPTSFLLTKDGKVLQIQAGAFKPHELESWLNAALKANA